MTRLTIEFFEVVARFLAENRGLDPDELTFFGGKNNEGEKRPRWVNLAEELRAHYEREQALDRGEL